MVVVELVGLGFQRNSREVEGAPNILAKSVAGALTQYG